MTAQTQLRDLLRIHVAPAIRDRGFAGSGQDFSKRMGHDWAVIDVQKHRYSTADEVRFTINLGVACPFVLAEEGLTPAGKAPPEVLCQYRLRIGQLLPSRQDTWWTVRSTMIAVETEVLGSTIVDTLLDVAIPALERIDHEAIVGSQALGDRFDDLTPAAMDVVGPILRSIGQPARFAAYLAAIDAIPPVIDLDSDGVRPRRRTGPAAIATAIRRLASPSWETRVGALSELSNATPTEDLLVAVRPSMGDDHPYVRKAAVGALASLEDLSSIDMMVSMIEDDPSRTAACAAAVAASVLAPRLSSEERSRCVGAVRHRHAHAVGHERPILRSLIRTFAASA